MELCIPCHITIFRYGGGFDAGASSMYNGSAIVAQSVARVSSFVFDIFQSYKISGHPFDIRELQLPSWAFGISARARM